MLSLLLLLATSEAAYTLKQTHQGTDFFSYYNFATYNDPTHGYVNYVDYNTAVSTGLVKTSSSNVIIAADSTNVVPNGARGRNSVRLESKTLWPNGLFIIDLTHQPVGCSTWPAFWTVGPNWPNGGEIDIIEGVNNQSVVFTTLHTSDGCTMCNENTNQFTGKWNTGSNGQPSCNCYINAANEYSNQGCSIAGAANTMGNPFNSANGGVFATEWDPSNHIATWFFPRGKIPADITNNNPDPSTWGLPYANFPMGSSCSSGHFTQQQIVFDLTFCGDWAGSVFASMCPGLGDCQSFVQYNPKAFTEAYWNVNYVKIFQK